MTVSLVICPHLTVIINDISLHLLPLPKYWKIKSEFALIRGWTLVLYGTVISPQKDDEPRQSSSSPSLVYKNNNYTLNTFYRPNINNYGTTNLYINRKQQSQHKSTTVSVQTATRKNGKQKNNGKGNKNNQRASTTPKPIYTTVMLNQFSSSAKSAKNKSKSSQSANSSSSNRMTTTRPRTTTRLPANGKSQSSDGGGRKNDILLSSKTDKLQPANSNIYEKSPGKAPKQVKELFTTPLAGARSTQSPMSKMFERYEKIEQIFPELKPYKDNPAYFTVTNGNGKPSRENSKSFSSFVSMNSASQNGPGEISTVTRPQVTSHVANEKSEKGTIQFIFSAITCSIHLLFRSSFFSPLEAKFPPDAFLLRFPALLIRILICLLSFKVAVLLYFVVRMRWIYSRHLHFASQLNK